MKITNLDLKELIPFERHSKIFENWDALKEGEALRIINDHEPKPLYYLFQAEYNGKFEWEYEQKGPKDWIFTIKKILDKVNRKQEIKNLIKQLKTKEDVSELKEKAKDILKNISSADLGLIEQEIIEEGTTRKEMRKLCDIHLEVMKDSLGKPEMNLKPGHPIHTLMEEHKEILDLVDLLKQVLQKIEFSKDFSDIKLELEKLRFIAKHLVEADKHHEREEKILFPELEKRGIIEPPQIMKEEHEELIPNKKELYNLAENYGSFKYSEFSRKVKDIGEYIIENLPDHIYKEDNILYPMAVQVIPEKEWSKIKKKCDKIGYCCFTPKC